MQKELDTQREVSQEFSKNSQIVINDYVDSRQKELRDKIKQAKTEEEKDALFNEIYKLQYQKRLLETIVGIISANPEVAVSDGLVQLAATKLREETLDNSRKFPGIHGLGKDKGDIDLLSNVSEDSGAFDGVKLGGTRLDLEAICGNNNERCIPNSDGSFNYIGDAQFPKLSDVIDPKQNHDPRIKNMYGTTGGMQGLPGTMFGFPYKSGSLRDIITEGFAGIHDYTGGQMWGWYDKDGTTSKGRDKPGNHDATGSTITADVAIPVAAPVAIPDYLPQSVMQAILNLLGH